MIRLRLGDYIGDLKRSDIFGTMEFKLHQSNVEPDSVAEQDHAHEEGHLMFVLDPDYRSSADLAPSVSNQPLLLYNPPGTVHRDHFTRKGGYFLSLAFPSRFVAQADAVIALPNTAINVTATPAHRLIRSMLGPLIESRKEDGLHLEANGLELLAMVSTGSAMISSFRPSWLNHAKEYLEDTLGDDQVTVGSAASAVGVHPIYLARVFRKHFDCTPGEYARSCRANRAAGLLRQGRYPLSQIAPVVGYVDQSHLNKEFRKHFGCSPKKYQRAFL